jgi:hypothetical protein
MYLTHLIKGTPWNGHLDFVISIKSFFPNYRVIVPEDVELAVLKGAVLFGHKPDYIVARITRYTYHSIVD